MVLVISNADVERVLTQERAMQALDDAYLELDKGLTTNRPRTFTSAPTSQGQFTANTHEGILATKGVYDIRIVTHSSRGRRAADDATVGGGGPGRLNVSLDLLYDLESGDLLAIMQDGYLQKMRVQATNAIAARYMAKKDARVMALIGSGWQATAAIEAMRFVRPIEDVRVYSRSPENRNGFAQRMQERYPDVRIRAVDAPQDAVAGADMVVAATNSRVPVCKGEWVEKGMHLTGVLPGEFDLQAYQKADYIVIFNRLHGRDYGLSRGPEEVPLKDPPHAHLLEGAPEIADLVSGKVPGRKSDDQITIFANGGHGWGKDGGPGYGIQFAAMAKLVYDRVRELELGREVPLDWFQQDINS